MSFQPLAHFSSRLKNYLQLDNNEIKKLFMLGLSFFFIISSYSILRSLKTSIFLGFVGVEYQPYTRFIAPLLMIPCMYFYSKLVDHLKRHQIVYVILSIYASLSIIFAFLFLHPVYGIQNTMTSPDRLLGWVFEIFMDLYSALVVSTFWGFVNSVCTPAFAKKGYGIIVASSKCGGILAALLGWYTIGVSGLADHHAIPFLIFIAGLLLFACIMMISLLKKWIPNSDLKGYQSKSKSTPKKKPTGMFSGLKNILLEPYVFGIFILLFSVETVLIIFDYQMQLLISTEAQNNIGTMSLYTLSYTGIFHLTALLFALFGTTTLLRKIGTRLCLFIMPFVLIALTALPLFIDLTIPVIFFIMVILRALNYGFNHPIRETLYIPTSKDIQFKSKAWIESFGKTFSKGSGSGFIFFINAYASHIVFQANSAIAFTLSCLYLFAAFFVGKKYDKTIKNNETIGQSKE